jgi:hypothetical protein
MTGQLRLTLAHSCHRELTWECELPQRSDAEHLASALRASNYLDESHSAAVLEFVDAQGHRIVLVPRSGRVQLRIHYLTPLPARSGAARTLAEALQALLQSAARPTLAHELCSPNEPVGPKVTSTISS